jgi:hypothetical protein
MTFTLATVVAIVLALGIFSSQKRRLEATAM